jgi:hypothetical protein
MRVAETRFHRKGKRLVSTGSIPHLKSNQQLGGFGARCTNAARFKLERLGGGPSPCKGGDATIAPAWEPAIK